MHLALAATAAGVALAAGPHARAQSTYDVSTVKPAKPGETGMMLDWRFASLQAKNVTLAWILTSALHARADQIVDLPGWAKDQHFDIAAKLTDMDAATSEKLTPDQHRALLLALLTERFGLKYHVETRQMSVYDLVPAKDGLKLTAAANSGDKTKTVFGLCDGCSSWGKNQNVGHDIGIPAFAEMLSQQLERDVNDRTGYTGKIDVELKWTPDLGPEPVSGDDASLPSLPDALQREMGLHLVTNKASVKLYIVEHLDMPSEN